MSCRDDSGQGRTVVAVPPLEQSSLDVTAFNRQSADQAQALTDAAKPVRMDSLVREFPGLSIAPANFAVESPAILTPRGLGLQLPLCPESFEEQRSKIKASRTTLAPSRGRTWSPAKEWLPYGFSAVDLMEHDALILRPGIPWRHSTLSNQIHPLLRIENFHGCPTEIYDTLKPGLRLATLLLTHQATAAFWHTLCFGVRRSVGFNLWRNLAPHTRISEDVSWTQGHADEFDRRLRAFAYDGTIHIYFHHTPVPWKHLYAFCGAVPDYKTCYSISEDRSARQCRICLHNDFYLTAKRLSLLKYPEPATVLRFHFFFAVNLCHELAHFIEMSHHRHHQEQEVYLRDYNWAECGYAFETMTFGGHVEPVSESVDCSHGLAICRVNENPVVHSIIPMEYIAWIQQHETWGQDFSNADGTFFHIPKTGARSVGLLGVRTMVWEDEAKKPVSDLMDIDKTPLKRTLGGRIVKRKTVGKPIEWRARLRPMDHAKSSGSLKAKVRFRWTKRDRQPLMRRTKI